MLKSPHEKLMERLEGLDEFDPVNYLAIEILEELSNFEPTQDEIDRTEALIHKGLKMMLIYLKENQEIP